MIVSLLHNTPLNIADFAISKCWDKTCDMDNVNKEKIDRVANKFRHSSTIEHLTYNFEIVGISRAVLQELARHRMANLSVKSTRYTLKELKGDVDFQDFWDEHVLFNPTADGSLSDEVKKVYSKYVVLTSNDEVNKAILWSLNHLQQCIKAGISNDIAKYCLPEAYKTDLVWTCNARALQNFLTLRTNKSALWEIRDLAYAVFEAVPDEHKFLFEGYLYEEKEVPPTDGDNAEEHN